MSVSKTEDHLYNSMRKLLHGRKLNLRRQTKIGRFTVDFLIDQPRLVVEVEGPFHDTPQASKRDRERMNYLNNLGYRVLRLSPEQVNEDPDAAADYVLAEARRTPVGTDSPPLEGIKRVRRILVEYQTDEGDWLEGEEADRWWSAIRQLVLDAWAQGKEAYTTHVNSHWNHCVSTDKSMKAHVDYEAGPDDDAQRFAARLPGRKVIQAFPEDGKVIVKIDLAQ